MLAQVALSLTLSRKREREAALRAAESAGEGIFTSYKKELELPC
jgi:hypothetical protein